MTTYIALFRGINVSGKNILKMTELKQLFLNLGYQDIITYIQSGNVIFKSNIKETLLIEDTITAAISNYFDSNLSVLILTKKDCPNGYGKTKLTNNLFENKFKTTATTRNWRTITKLVELSKQ